MKHIKPIGLMRTPANITEVQDWIANMPQSDQAGLSTAAFMTWNLMAGYHNDHVDQLQDVIKMLVDYIEEGGFEDAGGITSAFTGQSTTLADIKELIK